MRSAKVAAVLLTCLFAFSIIHTAFAEVMLQWFESDWDEMYRRLPKAAEIGYDYLWIPPPTKGPTGEGVTWANVGYNLYDRFDIGDIPQRGSLGTRYGTRGSLRNMVDKAHQLDIKIIPDIVMNHNGNGPDFREYPGMKVEDFHVQYWESYLNTLNYKRAPRMDQWYHDNGYGGTMWQDLANLIDIRTEDHPLNPDPYRFTGDKGYFNFVQGNSFIRHRGQYDKYPYSYTNELASEMLYRWIAWLGDAMDYDGLRLDAGKHTPYEFFGWLGSGFLHEAQWNYNARRGFSDANADEADQLFENYYAERDDALIFAEILSPWSEIEYWYGYGSNDRNPMRFLDFAMKKHADVKFNGDLYDLGSYGSDFGANNGILYVWGHDEGGPSKAKLAYAYILTHIGFPMVYFTGNNILWSDYGRAPYPQARTWMIPGIDDLAFGRDGNDITQLVWIHQQFARGGENKLKTDNGDFFALERTEDGEAILLVGLNDSGSYQTHWVDTSFPDGTVLHDYAGNYTDNNGNITVGASGGVTMYCPAKGDQQSWVCFAPMVSESLNVKLIDRDTSAEVGTMTWVIPGGAHANDETNNYPRITTTNLRVEVTFTPPSGESVDDVMLKWGQGKSSFTTNYFSTNYASVVRGRYEKMSQANATNWYLDITIGETNIPEGINVLKARVFNYRASGPARFNTATEVVYIDGHGPDIDVTYPGDGGTIDGEAVMVIENGDYTAYGMNVSIDGGADETAHEIMKGLWKYELVGLSAGTHTATVTTTEADWAASRQVINTSIYTRVFNVDANENTIALNHTNSHVQELTFFTTAVAAAGSPGTVRLYWDGYQLPFNAGTYTNIFSGEVIFSDPNASETDRLWGAFVNGQHFFEAERVDGTETSRVVRRVTFNLYGLNAIDSDGDALPDNVEMPYFDDGAPGPDQPWPGDDPGNPNFIPEWGEYWTRLNPYNHSTFYSGQWDDKGDMDNDGYSNFEEVYAGYLKGNIYTYDIYDGSSTPTSGTPATGSAAGWTPSNGVPRETILSITYYPNDGALKNATQVKAHIGHSKKTLGEWQDTIDTNMTASGDDWVVDYLVPTNATSVDFTFWDDDSIWDGSDWQATVEGDTNTIFTIDGTRDGNDYLVWGSDMYIWAAVRGTKLYVSTWGENNGNDHFIYVTDELGDAMPTPWDKADYVFFDTESKPHLGREGDNLWSGWFNTAGNATNVSGNNVLEGEFDLVDTFGSIPDALYICAVSYETGAGTNGEVLSQGPSVWDSGNNLDIMEFLRVPVSSISDADGDGYFDVGRPQMWTVVGTDTNDANYGLRRVFLDERAGNYQDITVILQPNGGTSQVSNVELFSNINRRNFAALPGDEDWDTITTDTRTNYYRAYAMSDIGGGQYRYTIRVNKCGAYRINARYKLNGGDYIYYTDNGLRRDCAVVASPKKALDSTMYELNPMIAEATSDDFFGRSTFYDMYAANPENDYINTNHFTGLGLNMVWLQPVHPIGSDNRDTDPATGGPYDPGSPYAVRNYWKVNSILGNPDSEAQAMAEFTNFVQALDGVGVGVMLDGTFNHSAWDCLIGQVAVDMGLTYDVLTVDAQTSTVTNTVAVQATDLIREVRPQWYSKYASYGEHATYYESASQNDIAPAPDRIDFGKWDDAADFFFGSYDTLVREPAGDTNWAWSSKWYNRYLLEEDRYDGFQTNFTRELWEYFAYYPIYWLEKTGHAEGTPKSESYKGIDGLRCDFAQGLPSLFWEYTINKTRSVKWDFLFMAESLDGYREVAGSKRHGVGFRSGRHFDILNENMVFYWRDTFFDYLGYESGPQSQTTNTYAAINNRRNAFDTIPILLNLCSHDEIYPSDDPWRLAYAYTELSCLDGVPMMLYGQEAGAQNDANNYPPSTYDHNFARYETNFNKSIPSFKRYNHMQNIWSNRMWDIQNYYGRVGNARLASPALKSQNNYFLSPKGGGWLDDEIFAVAKFEEIGVSAATQDVVFIFVSNDYDSNPAASQLFDVSAQVSPGVNWFGIQPNHLYNVQDLLATNPSTYLWSSNMHGSVVTNNGIYVGFPYQGQHAHYLKLVDITDAGPVDTDGDGLNNWSDWDDDGDGLSDDYENANGLDPLVNTGDYGGSGDKDKDGMSNLEEQAAGTDADDADSVLELFIDRNGSGIDVSWDSVVDINYSIERIEDLAPGQADWQQVYFGTALDTNETIGQSVPISVTSRFFRAVVKP